MREEKNVLVTGGAGFIGSNLCRALLADGAHVDCVDNLITGDIAAIQPLRDNGRFRFFKLDVARKSFVTTVMNRRYDDVYHLACPTGVPNIRTYGEEMIRTCSIGTANVLEVATTHNARLVYSSSAEVYGDPEVFPQREAYCGRVDPVGPRSAYEEGKRFGEAMVRLYAEKYLLDAKIVRIFNTFGVGMRIEDSRVVPHFIRRVRDGKSVIIYGDGNQTRTYLYVADLIAALQTIMGLGARGEVYNVGGEQQLSILELVELLRGLTPLPVDVEHRPHFIEDHGGRLPMTAKVRALGWEPTVSIQEGLRRTLLSYDLPVHDAGPAAARGRTVTGEARLPLPSGA
jgi:nucleoside-diphosphate-sugar epimerase